MKRFLFLCYCLLLSSGMALAQVPKPSVQLNHIAVYVVDLKISTHFYQNIIGLDTIPEPFHDGKHTWFSVGPKSHLHLIEGAESKLVHNKNTHLCFSVASVDSFTAN